MVELAKKLIEDFSQKNNIKFVCDNQYYPTYTLKDNSIDIDLKLITYLLKNMNIEKDIQYSVKFILNYFDISFYNQRSSFSFYYEKIFNFYIKDYKSYIKFMNDFYEIIQIFKEKIDLWGVEPKYNIFNKDDKTLFGNLFSKFLINHELFIEQTFYEQYNKKENLIYNFLNYPINKDLFKKFDVINDISSSKLSEKKFLSFLYINCSKLLFNVLNEIEIHICSPKEEISSFISYIKELKNLDNTLKIYFYVNILNKEIYELLNEKGVNVIFSETNLIITKNNNELWFLNNENDKEIDKVLDSYFNLLKENNINLSNIKIGFLFNYNGYLLTINNNFIEFLKKIKGMKTYISFNDFSEENTKKNFDILIKGNNTPLLFNLIKLDHEKLSIILQKHFYTNFDYLKDKTLYLGKYQYLFYLIDNNYSELFNIIYLKKDLNNQNQEKLNYYIQRDFYEFPCLELYVLNKLPEQTSELKEIIICKKRNFRRLLPSFFAFRNKLQSLYKKTILINISKFLSQKVIIKIEK